PLIDVATVRYEEFGAAVTPARGGCLGKGARYGEHRVSIAAERLRVAPARAGKPGEFVMKRFKIALLLGCFFALSASAAEPSSKKVEWKIGDTTREALVYTPEKAAKEPVPLVFVFHGHGGTMKYASTKMAIHDHWPEAICVYPQGLNTPGKLT